jgi:hypothetical protein
MEKETVSSALLRGFQYQEYEVRSAAEAMPEEKYGDRPPRESLGTKNQDSVLPRVAPLPNK